ncbi:MAG TPA: four-carbon acid sugar kinase family protein [Lacipirellulaceae bacterium]|nr:four-carbon acid sugar kinase family protein [Lacipirellulaceae bacterium]
MAGIRIAILADDLTGACDSAAPFASQALKSWVFWQIEEASATDAELVSACSNTRRDNEMLAAEKTRQMAEHVSQCGASRLFKKIDSTLIGNWAFEVPAIVNALRVKAAIVAPAFPAMGRRMIDGRLQLVGVSRSTSLLETLQSRCSMANYHVPLSELRKGPDNLAKLVEHQDKPTILVADSEIDSDLDIVAAAVEILGESVLPVGSAGLATAIARQIKSRPQHSAAVSERSPVTPPPIRQSGGTLIFVGSQNRRTMAQVNYLSQVKAVHQADIFDDSSLSIAEQLRRGINIVAYLRWDVSPANAILRFLENCERNAMKFVLTGGDTAQLVCGCCRARGIWIDGEIAPGLPHGRLCGGPFEGTHIATKAGGFGDREALDNIVSFLDVLPVVETDSPTTAT